GDHFTMTGGTVNTPAGTSSSTMLGYGMSTGVQPGSPAVSGGKFAAGYVVESEKQLGERFASTPAHGEGMVVGDVSGRTAAPSNTEAFWWSYHAPAADSKSAAPTYFKPDSDADAKGKDGARS